MYNNDLLYINYICVYEIMFNINIIYYNHVNYLLEFNGEIIYGNEKIKLDKKYN